MHPSEIKEFFTILHQKNPHPDTELMHTNPYTLLVAVVLSAQATDRGVNRATSALFKVVKTPADMVSLGVDGLKEYIKTINFYPTKARNIVALSAQLVARHEGEVPADRAALEALPGVGRKTANVVLNVAFGQPTIAVDTHIFRVSNRTGLAPGKTPREVETVLEHRVAPLLPADWVPHIHHWLILHGRYICKASRPLCDICPVRDLCAYDQARTKKPNSPR